MTDTPAEREHREAMTAHRGWAARNRERITAAWNKLPDGPRSMAEHIADAREGAGEERWTQLEKEWDDD